MRRLGLILAALASIGAAAIARHIATGDPGVCTCTDRHGCLIRDPHCTIHRNDRSTT